MECDEFETLNQYVYVSNNTFFDYSLSFEEINLPLKEISTVYFLNGNNNVKTINLPNLTRLYNQRGYEFNNIAYNCGKLLSIEAPKLEYLEAGGSYNGAHGGLVMRCPKIIRLCMGKLIYVSRGWSGGVGTTLENCPRLIDLEIGEGTNISLEFNYWCPTEGLLPNTKTLVNDDENYDSNLEKFEHLFKEHIIERLHRRNESESLLSLKINRNITKAFYSDTSHYIEDISVSEYPLLYGDWLNAKLSDIRWTLLSY